MFLHADAVLKVRAWLLLRFCFKGWGCSRDRLAKVPDHAACKQATNDEGLQLAASLALLEVAGGAASAHLHQKFTFSSPACCCCARRAWCGRRR